MIYIILFIMKILYKILSVLLCISLYVASDHFANSQSDSEDEDSTTAECIEKRGKFDVKDKEQEPESNQELKISDKKYGQQRYRNPLNSYKKFAKTNQWLPKFRNENEDYEQLSDLAMVCYFMPKTKLKDSNTQPEENRETEENSRKHLMTEPEPDSVQDSNRELFPETSDSEDQSLQAFDDKSRFNTSTYPQKSEPTDYSKSKNIESYQAFQMNGPSAPKLNDKNSTNVSKLNKVQVKTKSMEVLDSGRHDSDIKTAFNKLTNNNRKSIYNKKSKIESTVASMKTIFKPNNNTTTRKPKLQTTSNEASNPRKNSKNITSKKVELPQVKGKPSISSSSDLYEFKNDSVININRNSEQKSEFGDDLIDDISFDIDNSTNEDIDLVRRKRGVNNADKKVTTTTPKTSQKGSAARSAFISPKKPYDMKKYGELNKNLMQAYKEVFGRILEKYRTDPSILSSITETSMDKKPLWIEIFHSNPLLTYMPGKTCFVELGCFIADNYFDNTPRAFGLLPETPNLIDAKFLLNTSKNPRNAETFKYNISPVELKKSSFNPKLGTVLIVHGFWDGYEESGSWQEKLRKNLIIKNNEFISNVITVDWGIGSQKVLLPIAITNSRVLAAIMAFFLNRLKEAFSLDLKTVHCIGHDLGAHVCGWAAKRLNTKFGRITGLDPSGPFFRETDDRLSASDAIKVDVIHTDSYCSAKEGYGLKEPIGHFDFYLNGGYGQPGCKPNALVDDIVNNVVLGVFYRCSHTRAFELYNSFNDKQAKCQHVGYECPDYKIFFEGRCALCGDASEKCRMIGHWPEYWDIKPPEKSRSFYLQTGSNADYCLFHYQIALHINEQSMSENNKLELTFEIKTSSDTVTIVKSSHFLQPNNIYVFLYVNETKIGSSPELTFEWAGEGHVDHSDTIAIDFIEINHMSHTNIKVRDLNSHVLCPLQSNKIKHKAQQKFKVCEKVPKRMAKKLSSNELKSLS